ncbi:hypothetical protein FLL45_03885 [Aliikangiella marina]|uniref:Protein SirB1 N-terminal domain-containing protein n=1 Tax=Aliikangiella marina TaxID=1712262 RepID=A0A545TIP6_9GAMM|nr:transglutaminase family protein [Aliikangiella marina]TQV77100.1 hypothetical protein FLL45_03885 [Aliikangiella marina]
MNRSIRFLRRKTKAVFGGCEKRLIILLVTLLSTCVSANDFAIWSELTPFEVATLNSLEKAKRGDPDALLALYLVSSGDVRNEKQYRQILKQINHWVKEIDPLIAREPNDWQQGFRLHHLMHQSFFLGGKTDDQEGEGYDFEQSQLSEVFRSKKYNCVSASLLFTVLAHKFNFSTQGVLLPSHVFIVLELSGDRQVEIETTSAEGYDWVHDEAFYEQSASQAWFVERGLTPSTYADYQAREIISAYQLGVQNMKNQHVRPDRMNYADRMRLVELVSELDIDDFTSHKVRLGFYSREYSRLKDLKDYDALDKMYQQVNPFLERLSEHPERDLEIDNLLAWVKSQRVYAAIMNGRGDMGAQLAFQYIDQFDRNIEDFDKVVNNLYVALSRYIDELIANKQFTEARQVFAGRENDCLLEAACVNSFRHLYSKWASIYWESNDWPQVIKMYADFLNYEFSGKAAELFKENMQSAYLNWSIEFIKNEDWLGASEVLKQCVSESPSAARCEARLDKLQSQHQLDG